MPSFDVVSEIDMHEITNAVDQSNREVSTRFDFKGTNSKFSLEKMTITLSTENDFQLKQMMDILKTKLTKRGVDLGHIEEKEPVIQHKSATQTAMLKQGIDTDMGKKIVKIIKESKLKVQTSIQGDQVRVIGKKRDDLQEVIALLRQSKLNLPLQYINFRE